MGSLKAGVKWDLEFPGRDRDGLGVLVKRVEMDAIGGGGQALCFKPSTPGLPLWKETNNGDGEQHPGYFGNTDIKGNFY